MGYSHQYSHVDAWKPREHPYTEGDFTIYQGNVFRAAFWVAGDMPPAEGDPNVNSWRLFDELYDVTTSKTTLVAKVIAYVPTWRKSENFDYSNHHIYRNITHAIIAFLMFSETNLGTFLQTSVNDIDAVVTDVRDAAHAYNVKVLIALGGATDYGFLYFLTRIGQDPSDSLLQQTVSRVVSFVNNNDLDGVDLDLECWWDKTGNPVGDKGGRLTSDSEHAAGRGLAIFAKALRAAMPDKLLSAAFFATSWYGNNYPLVESLDWIGVMTYDLTGSWNNSPVGPPSALFKVRDQENYASQQHGSWPQSSPSGTSDNPMRDNPILSVEDSLWYWSNPYFINWQGEGQKLDRSKLAIGVPVYGYDFARGKEVRDPVSGKVPPGYKTMSYRQILDRFPSAHQSIGGNVQVKGQSTSPDFAGGGMYPFRTNLYYDTPAIAAEKMKFAKNLGMQGVIIWEVSNDSWEDYKSIIATLYRQSGNRRKQPTKGDTPLRLGAVLPDGAQLSSSPSSEGELDENYDSCFTYNLDGKHFWYGQSKSNKWAIRELLSEGRMGRYTARGEWNYYYRTMFSYEIGGRIFFYGQNIDNSSNWFIQELLPGGRMGEETAHGNWQFKYGVNVHFKSGNKSYFFGHRENKYWFIQQLHAGGLMGEEITNGDEYGFLDAYYFSAFPFSVSGRHFIYAQQSPLWGKKWTIREVGGRELWGDETDSGEWGDNFDLNIPFKIGRTIGFLAHSRQSNWFLRELREGKMGLETDKGNSRVQYVTMNPFNIDGRQYVFRKEYRSNRYDIQEVSFPGEDTNWISQIGNYGFQLHVLDSEGVGGEYVHTTKRVSISEVVPYFAIVLVRSDQSVDHPAGAYLKIEEPLEPELRHISLGLDLGDQGVIYQEPQLGTYEITLTVPRNIEFKLTICALPYRDPSRIGRNVSGPDLWRRSGGGGPGSQKALMVAGLLHTFMLNPRNNVTNGSMNYVTNSNPALPSANAIARRNSSPYIDPNLIRLVPPDIRDPPPGTTPIQVQGQGGPIVEYVQRREVLPGQSLGPARFPYDVTVWLHARICPQHLRRSARTSRVPIRAQNRARVLGEPTDDAGHIVADRFSVPNDILYNYFPQNPNFNSHRYVREVEEVLFDIVDSFGCIDVWWLFNFDDPNLPNRPTTFFVHWRYPDGSTSGGAYFYNPNTR